MEEPYLCQEADCVAKRHELRQECTQQERLTVSIDHHVSEEDVVFALDSIVKCDGANLQYLTLACGLSDKAGLQVAQLITVSTTLRRCTIPFNNFTGTTLAAIFQALWTNTSLETLEIYRINFCMMSWFVDNHLINAMWFNSGIRSNFVFNRSEYSVYNASPAIRQYVGRRIEELGHPPLQYVLYRYLRPTTRHTKTTLR